MKKLYLLFAFLFALIGYQDAGAWNYGSSYTDNYPMGGWEVTSSNSTSNDGWSFSIKPTWDDTNGYCYDIKPLKSTIYFMFNITTGGNWFLGDPSITPTGSWSSAFTKNQSYRDNNVQFTLSGLDTSKIYTVRLKSDDNGGSFKISYVEKGVAGDPIKSVALTNGTNTYNLQSTGDHFSINTTINPASGYKFVATTVGGKTQTYYLANATTPNVQTPLTSGEGTFSLTNFTSVTVAYAYLNSDNTGLSTAKFAGTVRTTVGVLGGGVGTAWNDANALSLDYNESTGEYVRENVPFTADKAFKLLIGGTRYGTTGTRTLSLNQSWYETVSSTSDGNDIKLGVGGNYTLRVKQDGSKWYVRVTGTQQLTSEWYLCGTFTSHNDANRIPMDNLGDGIHTAIIELSGSGNFDLVRGSDSKHFSHNGNTYTGGVATLSNALVEYSSHTTADKDNCKYKDLASGKYLFTWNSGDNTIKIQPAKTYEVRLVGPGVGNVWDWSTGVTFERQDDGAYHAHGVQIFCNTAFRIDTRDNDDILLAWTRAAAADGQNPIIYSNTETPYEAYVSVTPGSESAPGMRLNPAYAGGSGEYDVVITLDDEGRPSITVYGENNGVWPRVYLYREDGKAHALTKIDDKTWARDAFDTPLGKDFRYYIRVDADANTPASSKFYMVDGQLSNSNYQVPNGVEQTLAEFDPNSNAGRMRFYLTGEAETGTFRQGVVNAAVTFDESGVPSRFVMSSAQQWYISTSDGSEHVMTSTGNPGEYAVTFPLTGNGTFSVGEKVGNLKYSDPNLVFNEVVTVSRELGTGRGDCSYNRLTGLNYTFTWNADTHVLTVSFPGSTEYVNAKLNMPLKPADFEDGKKHYFVVGNRMGAWRLQPEWELHDEDGDGVYELKDRLMYTGYFMIAEVDNYPDYIKHIYTAYSKELPAENNNWDNGEANRVHAKNGSASIILSKQTPKNQYSGASAGKWSAILYNVPGTQNQFGLADVGGAKGVNNGYARMSALNFMGALRDDNTGAISTTEGDPRWDQHITKSFPTLVGSITFNPNNYELKFSNMTSEKAAVKEQITFSIVGSAFRHQQYDTKATDARTPRAHYYTNVDDFEQGWQDGYIQFDEGGVPYVDGNGEFLYQTVFQANWMNAHPTRFRNKTGFEYSSNGLMFTYDATRSHSNDFGQKTDETLRNYQANNSNDTRTIPNLDCYVVENVWMRGAFKLWTGWAGSIKTYSGSDNAEAVSQWNYRNGGHGIKNVDRLAYGSPNASKVMFATFNDVGSDDFAVSANLTDAEKASGIKAGVSEGGVAGQFTDGDGTRTYFKRIELWWDRDKGFDNSVIRFYQQAGGPAIWISRMDNEHIGYNYNILPETRSSENVYVSKYEIKRYKVGNDGVTLTQQGDAITGTYADGEMEQAAFCYDPNIATYCTDTPVYGAGTYRYGITVWYHNDAAGNDPDETDLTGDNAPGYKAYSNDVVFREMAQPIIDARQVTQTVDGQTIYSFDVEVTASAPSSIFDRIDPTSETETITFAEILHGFKVTLPAVEASQGGNAFYTSLSVEDGGSYVVNPDKTITLYPIEETTADGNVLRMPKLTLNNVIPNTFGNSYAYTVEMVGDPDNAEKWAIYNAEAATVRRMVVAPQVTINDFKVTGIVPVDEDHPFTPQQSSNSDKPIAGGMTGDYIQDYTKFNQLIGEGTISGLNVTDEVLRDWQVTYDLTLSRAGMTIRYVLNSNSAAETVAGKTVPATAALKLNDVSMPLTIEYMNVPYSSQPLTAAPTASDAVKKEVAAANKTYDSPINQTGTGTLTISYRRRVNGTYSSATVKGNQTPSGGANAPFEANIDLSGLNKLLPVTDLCYHSTAPEITPISVQLNHVYGDKNWYNAFIPMSFTAPASDLNYGVGFYASNGAARAHGAKAAPYGGEVVDFHNDKGYSDRWNINRNDEGTIDLKAKGNNFAEVAVANSYLPIKLHHVLSTESTKYDADEVKTIDDAHIILMTEYPILMHKTGRDYMAPIVSVDAAPLSESSAYSLSARANDPVEFTHISGGSNRHLTTISIPAYFDAKVSGGTTDLDAIEGDVKGSLTLFPNPAVDVVNIRSNAAIGKVEIVSVDGSLVKTADIADTAGTIDVSDMTSGLYIVRTQAGTARLIVR